jgi:hypothetical protein
MVKTETNKQAGGAAGALQRRVLDMGHNQRVYKVRLNHYLVKLLL